MTNKMKSFRNELLEIMCMSLVLTFLTELGILACFYLFIRLTGIEPMPQGLKMADRPYDFTNSLVYGSYGDYNSSTPSEGLLANYFVLFVLVVVALGVLLFIFYFFVLTKRLDIYLKEIESGIQEISIGNFENQIPVKSNDELSVIAHNLNEMSSSIYNFLCDERQNEDVKSELITSVAHDLRTPLTSIIGYMYLVLYRQDLEEEKKKHYLQVAFDKSKRLEQLIEDLFNYSKYSTDEVKLNYEKIDFVRFMEQMVEEFYPSFKDNELEYEFNSDIQEANISADGNLLARAVGNLISNAIKYGKDGKMIKIHVTKEDDYVCMSVLNYGEIIPEEGLKHIFERFYRVENSRSQETGGSGLGLAIAKQIVTLHDGMIDVKSDFEGTVFEIKLKLDRNSKGADDERKAI